MKQIPYTNLQETNAYELNFKKFTQLSAVLREINNYENKWIKQVCKIDRFRLQYSFMKYHPTRKRKPGRY
jgi:hypothetical protein